MPPLPRSSELYFTRNDLISMEEAQEITFDIFGILLNFCVFLIFLEIPWKKKTPYWPRYSAFKVEDMRFTKGIRTQICLLLAHPTFISLEMTLYRQRKLRRSLLTFLKFCSIFGVFWFFWKFPKKWKPLIDWDTALLKLKICVLQRDSELNTATNSLIWPLFHSEWPHIDGGSSGDHFWHFWNFAEFLCFSEFFGYSLKNENPLLAEIQRF